MVITTVNEVAGMEIVQHLGLVRGSTVRAKDFFKDWVAHLRGLVGGEINEYTRLQAEAREQALARMIQDAQNLGADAVIGVRMATSMIAPQVAEVLIYDTAVKLGTQPL